MARELPKVYEPQQVETRIYDMWQEGGYFHANVNENKKPYTIVMPPPNVTGQLHMGHAVDNTMQDILIRTKRMQGFETLWLPGTDHASIATEAKVVEAMRKEGLTKEMVGRDGFLERAWEWKNTYGNRIVQQLKKLGSSCDWERERFTMDEGCSDAVKEVFIRLYKEGNIYRGNRMVNWCPKCNTSISDAEVEHEEQAGNFWHLLYPVKETGEMLELATTRPETMLGDTAVAINAEDPRYAHLHGCHVILPLLNKEIPIVCDEHADMTKGTGVVKITPAHDPNDYEVGQRHNLPSVRVFTYDGFMTGAEDKAACDELFASGRATVGEPEVLDCGKYAGMTTAQARKAIVADLQELGLLKEIEPLTHEVGTCYRCHNTIEPMISKQWFVKMEPLAGPAVESVEKGEIKFVPERFTKNYINWMKGSRDWCISRQLWWGHQIPAWYCDDCGEMIVAKEAPAVCPKCGKSHLTQDPDTLDTWFSSALWPFSTLGWPDEDSEDLKYFYPTNTLVTGYDIIGFWVSRMIFSGLAYTGKAPFGTVCIHGIVRDSQGRKMSKSLGNGIDPLVVIEEFGADALRFMLVDGSTPGNDMRYSEEKVKAARNFANKLWNASRYVLMSLPEGSRNELPDLSRLEIADKWVLCKLNALIAEVTENLEKYEMGMAVHKVYDYIWDTYCDWYIELTKARLYAEEPERKDTALKVLVYVLDQVLRLLHPFMPFITEEIWQSIPHEGESLMLADWPVYKEELNFKAEKDMMESVMDAIRAIRNRRAEMNVPPSKKAALFVLSANPQIFSEGEGFLQRLAYADEVTLLRTEPENLDGMVTITTADAKLYIPMGQLVDVAKELDRIGKELEKNKKFLASLEAKLSNEKFVGRAPEAVVNAEREKAAKTRDLIASLEQSFAAMQKLG
ncbi:MAG: valine--tRNA ligase [Oscillospiraceae bacterium]|nr:valine--tRNA ligase [Oscillospiraceae bacterium]